MELSDALWLVWLMVEQSGMGSEIPKEPESASVTDMLVCQWAVLLAVLLAVAWAAELDVKSGDSGAVSRAALWVASWADRKDSKAGSSVAR